MPRRTIADRVLSLLAEERRIIIADWRFHVCYMRVARSHGFRLPNSADVQRLLGKMSRDGTIEPVDDIRGIYRVIIPYASSLPAPGELILSEADPGAALAFFNAISFHGLTVELPVGLHAIASSRKTTRLPLGTTMEDWVDVPEPRRRHPNRVEERHVHWTRVKTAWDFGVEIGYIQGMPIYVTTLEKTLVDGLRFPEKAGGSDVIIQAWEAAGERIRTSRIIEAVDRYGQALLAQRVGFMCEQVGLAAPEFDGWARSSRRGGSAKLIANAPFAPCYSPRWSLSINVPLGMLPRVEEIVQ